MMGPDGMSRKGEWRDIHRLPYGLSHLKSAACTHPIFLQRLCSFTATVMQYYCKGYAVPLRRHCSILAQSCKGVVSCWQPYNWARQK